MCTGPADISATVRARATATAVRQTVGRVPSRCHWLSLITWISWLVLASPLPAQGLFSLVVPEERTVQIRPPSQLPHLPLPDVARPPTVLDPQLERPEYRLTLDEAVRIALANSEVVRVLSGVTAVASGRTVYDPAIVSTSVDEQRARFDPRVVIDNFWNRIERPFVTSPLIGDPFLDGSRTDRYDLDFLLSKQLTTGGRFEFGVTANRNQFDTRARETASAADLALTQPLLQGGGWRANLAPIVLARIDAERSFFQLKGALQEMVRGVIEGYWALVAARTSQWILEQQLRQAEFAYERAEAEFQVGRGNAADRAQADVSRNRFRTQLVVAENNVIEREAALKNLLGLPPNDPTRFIPITPPRQQKLQVDWAALMALAEEQRPDVIELKLVLEADQQLLIQANNNALPKLDAVAVYRWNGLDGEVPVGNPISSRPGQFTDWTLGVNFSVPLGLRAERARLRRQELVLARDRANLEQGLHAAVHQLAADLRGLDRLYRQYEIARETREAARVNLDLQFLNYQLGRTQFINLLLAINDWGDTIGTEAEALTQYNSLLAGLELDTGTILESHGVRFFEERFGTIGPLGRLHHDRLYPLALPPSPNSDRYPASQQPAEQTFRLENPVRQLEDARGDEMEPLPPPRDGLQDPARGGSPGPLQPAWPLPPPQSGVPRLERFIR